MLNPSLFDETNFRKLRRTLICARKKALFTFLYARKKRTKVSRTEKEEDGREREVIFLCREKSAIVLVSESCFCELLYNTHITSQKPRRRDTRMEHHESATLMTANDDERVALLLKSGSKRMMTPVSSSFAQKRTAAAPTMKAVSIACFVCFCAFAS